MANPWFKMPSEIMEDVNIVLLSESDQRHYVWLLAAKNNGVLDKFDAARAREFPNLLKSFDKIVAHALWVSPRKAVGIKRRLMEAHLIDEAWQPFAWESMHSESAFTRAAGIEAKVPKSDAERARDYRQRKKDEAASIVEYHEDVTARHESVTEHHEAVTARHGAVTKSCAEGVTGHVENDGKTQLKTMSYDTVTLLFEERDEDRDKDIDGEKEKTTAKTKEMARTFAKSAHAEPEPPVVPAPMPAPLVQAPSVFDGWIFAETDPTEPAPAPEPEPTAPPPPIPAPSAHEHSLFDGSLFADDKFALTPKEEAEVDMLLFGKTSPRPSYASIEVATPGKTSKRKRTQTLGIRELVAEGADSQHAEDWLCVRKVKHAPLTITAWNEIKREGKKAGLTPAEVVEMCAARGWRGFKASWLSDTNQNNQGFVHSRHTPRHDPLEILAI